jgi:hypothetical protein
MRVTHGTIEVCYPGEDEADHYWPEFNPLNLTTVRRFPHHGPNLATDEFILSEENILPCCVHIKFPFSSAYIMLISHEVKRFLYLTKLYQSIYKEAYSIEELKEQLL